MDEKADLHNFFDVNESLLLPVLSVDCDLTSRLLMTKTLSRQDRSELSKIEDEKLKVVALLEKLTTRGPKAPRRFVEAAAPQLTPELLEEMRNDLEKITSQSQNLPVSDDDYTRKFALSDKKKNFAVQQPREETAEDAEIRGRHVQEMLALQEEYELKIQELQKREDEERRKSQNEYSREAEARKKLQTEIYRLNESNQELQQAKAKMKQKVKSLKSELNAIVAVEEKPQTENQDTQTETSKSQNQDTQTETSKSQNQDTQTDASTATSTIYRCEAASFAVEDRLSSPAAAEPRAEGQRPRLTRAQRQQLERAWDKDCERGAKDGDLLVQRKWRKALSDYCRGASEQDPDPPQLPPDAAAVYAGEGFGYWFSYCYISGELLQLCEQLLGPAAGLRLTWKRRGYKFEFLDESGRLYYCGLCFWFSSSDHCVLARPEASLQQALDVTQFAGRSLYQKVDGGRRSLQSSTTVQQLWTHAQSPFLYVE